MSDSDTDGEYYDEIERFRALQKWSHIGIPIFHPEEVLDRWCQIPVKTKKDATKRMKICAFWFPIMLQREAFSNLARSAVDNGLINSDSSKDLTPKNLRKIKALEFVLGTLEKASMNRDLTKRIVLFSNRFIVGSLKDFSEVLLYLKQINDPVSEGNIVDSLLEMGPDNVCYSILQMIFTEFAKFIREMGRNVERTMRTLDHQPPECHLKDSEEMKRKGNENFEKQKYEEAVKFYSTAISYHPDNHILYGNRALSYIRCKKYLKAAGDGCRATLIEPLWAKGHYRYSEALFYLGEHDMAVKANMFGRLLCKDDVEGTKNLEQQLNKFIDETEAAGPFRMRHPAPRGSQKSAKSNHADSSKKVSEVKGEKRSAKTGTTAQTEANTKDPKPSKSEFSSNGVKPESNNAARRKAKNQRIPVEGQNRNQKGAESKTVVCKELRSLVRDAHTALVDLRSRNAEQAFSQALTLLETTTPKELGLTTLDVLLLMFGRASALTEIGQPQELTEAHKVLEKVRSHEERTIQCLVYYAIGRVYLKENRFSVAVQNFSDSLQMVKNQITPGKLTWPLTTETVKETQPHYFKEVLESAIELCRFPPPPDAFCRHEKCISSVKAQIYFTDPDFKGFIQMCCCQSCAVEYHMACWKSLKTLVYNEKNEKDFIQEPCLTPDCVGFICSIKIYGPTGLVKCKFETAIPTTKTNRKLKVNQKCTSLKKLKSKEERKVKRKQHKQSYQEKQAFNDEILQQNEDSATPSAPKVWLLYRDRVLLQIKQNLELLREETGFPVSALTRSLRPWLELDASRGNPLAARILNWQQDALPDLGEVVELLLERKNRVWARIFIQQLGDCADVNPKLSSWVCRLNDAGLNASRTFIDRHASHLEHLDLAQLLNFGPLQDMIIEKVGTRPEFFLSIGLTVTEYLRQAPPHDMRLFIWTLEEHREHYVSCHNILDEYFDMMDGHCSVLKKSDENNSPMRAKNRGRKKKQKEPRGVIVLSGSRGQTTRDELNQDFLEDDSLSFLHPVDSFVVPSYLRDQVAEFEEEYNQTAPRTTYDSNNSYDLYFNHNRTKDCLYEYFGQILEEHGPLEAEDPLLVGELRDFPAQAQQMVQECGGFKPFLLQSHSFIKVGGRIGLEKHGVFIPGLPGACLDELDSFTDPDAPLPDFPMTTDYDLSSCADFIPFQLNEVHPAFPNPYSAEFQPAAANLYHDWSNGDGEPAPYEYEELDLYTSEVLCKTWEEDSLAGDVATATVKENRLKMDAAVQTCGETLRSVAVNTEAHEQFESVPGDINKKEKSNMKLEKDIQKMTEEFDHEEMKKSEDVVLLEEEVYRTTASIQVTNQELLMFQQKLEEEVKKDQKEKKAHQEALKSLKQDIAELVEEQASLARSIRERKASYNTKLNDFIDLSNQSATEKMSLEDEIKRCRALLTSASQRALTTQLLVAENSRDQSLYGVHRELTDAKALLTKLDEAQHRFPNRELEVARSSCSASIEELKKKISTCEKQYQEQIKQVKSGRRVNELPAVNTTNKPETAASPLSAAALHRPAPASRSTPPPPPPPAAEAASRKTPTRFLNSPSHSTKFEKTMESLSNIFPDYTRPEIMRFIQELRSSHGGSLSSVALQDVISGATQLILDHQEGRGGAARSNMAGRSSPSQSRTPPPAAPVWQTVEQRKGNFVRALNMEDPCIICHEDMKPGQTCVLACRHGFHNECIRSWLKEQSTCPTCRTLALLPEDFPALSGRKRLVP